MTADELRAAGARYSRCLRVSKDCELLIFGSQAILGSHPNAPAGVRASIEIDLQPKNLPEMVEAISGALGEDSLFHATHGFWVDGVLIDVAKLPAGWEERTIGASPRCLSAMRRASVVLAGCAP